LPFYAGTIADSQLLVTPKPLAKAAQLSTGLAVSAAMTLRRKKDCTDRPLRGGFPMASFNFESDSAHERDSRLWDLVLREIEPAVLSDSWFNHWRILLWGLYLLMVRSKLRSRPYPKRLIDLSEPAQ
jgi:hypothetical protein